MFFAKGEIIMNNIYKVIWSKAKNCYVVASEIAKSHTKSASGQSVRRSALASLLALSLLCGGLGVAEASVHVNENTGGAYEVLTKQEVTDELNKKVSTEVADLKYAKASDVLTNTANIATNKADITALQSELDTKADKTYVDTEVGKKADKATTLAGYGIADAYSKGEVDNALNNKADKATTLAGYGIADAYTKGEVDNALNKKADKATTLAGYGITDAYTKAEVNTAVANAVTTAGNNVDTKLADYAKTTYVDTEVGKKADKATTLAGYGITDAYTKGDVDTKLDKKADQAALTQATDRITVNENAIAGLTTKTTDQQTAIDDLKKKTTQISYADGDGTRISGVTIKDGNIVGNGNSAITGLTNVATGSINGKSLAGTTVATEKDVSDAVKVETDARTAADTVLEGKINDEKAAREAEDTNLSNRIGTVTEDGTYIKKSATNNVSENLKVLDTQAKTNAEAIAKETADRRAAIGELAVNGNYIKKDKNVSDNLVELDKQAKANADEIVKTNERTGGITRNPEKTQTTIEGAVKVDNQGNVKDVKGLSAETITTGALNVTGASDLKGDVILGTNAANTVTVNGTANFNAPVNMDKGLNVTNGETKLQKTTVDGNLKVTGTITTDKMVFGDKATNNYTEIDKGHITSKNDVLAGDATKKSSSMELDHSKLEVGVADKDSNGHLTMTADQTSIKNSDLDEKNYSEIVADKDSVTTTVKDEKGNTTSTKSSATEIRNYAKDKDGNKTINAQSATQNKSWAKDKDGNESSIVQTGKDITNTAEKGTITSKAKDIVNDASGNISNKSQTMDTTVTGKATESYGSLDTTVKGNETHIVKGTKTETVDGKVTENYKAGQETNVTGDQDIKVSGTQTTTATDINRNASSGMIDTVENAFGSNTETKVAGQTTTDVKLASGEEGHYIRGATESRDYLLNGALKNSETKTAEATSSEITDGTNTASTRQDAKNLAGSVTNGTETGINGIHANADGSVSIDSAVAGGGMSSVINQKKDSITSAVGDGTNSTVILQDKDNVTIASSDGTVGIVGNDIVNNAQNTITNTAGTSITNQVNDSKVTTDANGTTFENNTPAVSDGGATTTKINGNQITTGRVNANELGVSDKDGANTADFSVEAGEGKGVNASAGNGTTTGSLDVTAEEVSSSVKDASGKGSTFKQRIDKIMMESKDVSIKAEGTLTNEAKDIVTNASNSITEKVGETNVTTKTTTSSKSEIQNADTITSVQQTENMVQSYVGKKDGSATNVTTNFANASANMVTQDGQTSTVLNNKDGLLVRNTANGSSFIMADGTNTGAALEWTNVKGNEISTGKVEANYVKMDYADVMKDLGVHGNAKVDQNLEVGGTSTLKGNVTMESNATVKKDLKVEGTTTTKTLKVTENAEIDGTLKVAKKATFEDSVSIAKDLSVGGDVTAKSYKVGDKTYIDANGIHANGQKITDVADGSISEGSKDAVNGGQLYGVKRDLEHQVDKVGANAAAMANLRPMEFDPSSKWNIAAAIGNYGSETAAALGAFYRPNDDVMVNLSTAFGTGENMVGGGVSVRLGKGGNKLSREENNALKAQVDDLTARMDALLSVLNPNMSKDFPDVPENHWAYEAVSRLAGNDIVQGYPDGEFHGERTMTRYEMAEIIYNALSRGAEAEKELVEEFKPELQAMAASEKATAEKAEG